MPYIKNDSRSHALVCPINAGELNYKITTMVTEYLLNHGLSYKSINDVVGALECVKQEFLRRVVAPYEDVKCKTNGDVYPPKLLPTPPVL